MRDNHQAAAVSDHAYCLLTKASATTALQLPRHADERQIHDTATPTEVKQQAK